MRRLLAAIAAAPMIITGLVVVAPAAPANAAGELVRVRLHAAVKQLPVRAETPRGYERDKFGSGWTDADRDCRDTRAEVLRSESKRATTGRCTVRRGRWFSYYDHRTWRRASDVDIDHLVALKEAWDSGAKRWNRATRVRYANDLAEGRTLIAVTDNVNQSKGARDPKTWMPRYGKCRYVRQWAAVKIRWSLKVNRGEKRALRRLADGCGNKVIKVRKAIIRRGSTGSGGGGGGGSTDPRFEYCYQAIEAGYGPYNQGQDEEYSWYTDSDSDGVVCET